MMQQTPKLVFLLLFAIFGYQQSMAHEATKTRFPSMPIFSDYGTRFNLTDHNGNSFTEQNLLGQYSLVYFGYTSCPDVCALALYSVGEALDGVPESRRHLTPLFVNLDEERTSLPDLKEYVQNFHPDIVGLSGEAVELRKIAAVYETRFKAVGEGEDRVIVHSGMMFLLGPDGEALAMLPHDASVEWLAATMNEHLPDGQ